VSDARPVARRLLAVLGAVVLAVATACGSARPAVTPSKRAGAAATQSGNAVPAPVGALCEDIKTAVTASSM
jgi:hypothetical protein